MMYQFRCSACSAEFEANLSMNERDAPLLIPCKQCNTGKINRVFTTAGISYAGNKSAVRRAGSGWNDVLKKIKSTAGRTNTIDTF